MGRTPRTPILLTIPDRLATEVTADILTAEIVVTADPAAVTAEAVLVLPVAVVEAVEAAAAVAVRPQMLRKNPPHPGDLIRTEILDPLDLNLSKASEVLKVRRATLSDLLYGKAALTPEMALRIEKAFGPDMNHLLRMQFASDVAKAKAQSHDIDVSAIRGDESPSKRPLVHM